MNSSIYRKIEVDSGPIFRILVSLIFIGIPILYLYSFFEKCYFAEMNSTISHIEKDIRLEVLLNLNDFRYEIDNNICQDYNKDLLGIMIVTSYVGHNELRAAHREALPQSELIKMGFLRVFLLAEVPAKEKYINQSQIVNEHIEFGDLLQGNFVEDYRNLSYKHVMGIRWAGMNCSQAKFIIKIDDDIVFDIFRLKNYLEVTIFPGKFFAGYFCRHIHPTRSISKYQVTWDEYAGTVYPDFVLGALYITNSNTALEIVHQSTLKKFFVLDDVFVTGILRYQLAIPIIKLNSWFRLNPEYFILCFRDLSYKCEYSVSLYGNDTKFIVKFIREIEKCYFGECNKRTCASRAERADPLVSSAVVIILIKVLHLLL